MRAWVTYSLIRVGIILAVFVLLLVLGVEWWIAAVAATVIALCVSYIFLAKLRGRVSEEIAERRAAAGRAPAQGSDEGVEDALGSEHESGREP